MPESPADKTMLAQAQTRLPLNGLKVLDLEHWRGRDRPARAAPRGLGRRRDQDRAARDRW